MGFCKEYKVELIDLLVIRNGLMIKFHDNHQKYVIQNLTAKRNNAIRVSWITTVSLIRLCPSFSVNSSE